MWCLPITRPMVLAMRKADCNMERRLCEGCKHFKRDVMEPERVTKGRCMVKKVWVLTARSTYCPPDTSPRWTAA